MMIVRALGCVMLAAVSVQGQCVPHFVPGYNGPTLSGNITAGAVFGGQLYASGTLQIAPSTTSVNLARFNGSSWTSVPNLTLNSIARTMNVRVENGQEVMYLGGPFTAANGQAAAGVLRWNGQTITPFPGLNANTGLVPGVHSIEFFDDGAGEAMYASGPFGVAKWNGSGWVSLGALTGSGAVVHALRAFDDGAGVKLYAAGKFSTIGGQAIHSVAVWNGTWQPANSGLLAADSYPTEVYSLTPFDDGSGVRLWAAGLINMPSRNSGNTAVARLEGGTWVPSLGTVEGGTTARAGSVLLPAVEGGQPVLYATSGGAFESPNQVRRLQNGVWTTVGQAVGTGFGNAAPSIPAMVTLPGDQAPTVLGMVQNGARRWNGTSWVSIETWGLGRTSAVARIYSDPADGAGTYWSYGPVRDGVAIPSDAPILPGNGMARFSRGGVSYLVFANSQQSAIHDGSLWTMLPSFGGTSFVCVRAGDDAGGGNAFLGLTSGSTTARIYTLSGNSWTQVGPDITGNSVVLNTVATYDSGSGPEVYVGGVFGPASNQFLLRLVNGQWTEVAGVDGPVRDLITFDFPQGRELVMAGDFTATTGITADGVARWNGQRVASLGGGLLGAKGTCLAVFNDGTGDHLYAGAENTQGALRYWNGATWPIVGAFSNGATVSTLAVVRRAGAHSSLMVGGSFVSAGSTFSSNIAEFAGCVPTCTSDFNGDGDTGTDQDIEAFFACLGGNCCGTCGSPDFNNDGDTGTDQDIESFFRVLGGGAC